MATSKKTTPEEKIVTSSQITDAVTQTNVKVVSETPAMAIGNVYQTAAHSLGLLYENSVSTQGQTEIAYNATISVCVQSLIRN
ncbi:RebB family R body protein [uncultured Kordia sp.]|uniref:RebB family R body protein n=1 Tax=uncultured Kordia sp. TaxID=507699 RepID=UPI00261C1E23|nr:RebB family R body protein [uncultured Kordia sp.]